VYSVDPDLLDRIAEETIRAHMRMAAAEGAGLGMGGLFTMLPDLGILAAITLRMIQKLSLLYGFPYNTEQEEAELWTAAASAAGVDISRELVEKAVCPPLRAARDPAHCGQRQRGDCGEVGSAPHSGCQRGDRRQPELLLREDLGRARSGTLSPEAPANTPDEKRDPTTGRPAVELHYLAASATTGEGTSV
jgi:hypothetical protein